MGEQASASRYPRKRITKQALDAMADCTGPHWEGLLAPDGWSIWREYETGRLVIVHAGDRKEGARTRSFADVFYPVVRVVAPSRPISMAEYFFHGLQWSKQELAAFCNGPAWLYFDEAGCRIAIQQLKDYEIFQ